MGRMKQYHIDKMNEEPMSPRKQQELDELYEGYLEGISLKTYGYDNDINRTPMTIDLRAYNAISSVDGGKASSIISNDGVGLVIATPYDKIEWLFKCTR